MLNPNPIRIAILYPGDYETRQSATPENNRFAPVFQALAAVGVQAEPAVYHDDFCPEVLQQLHHVDGVLVWFNPIEGGRDRTRLDAMLWEIAATGVFVSAHPDIILKMGTKEVLYQTRELGWGSDIDLYRSMTELRQALPIRLAQGEIRVLKQYRGQSGSGVWKVELATDPDRVSEQQGRLPHSDTRVQVRHAQRGSVEESMTLGEFYTRCEPYFGNGGLMVDQAYQPRLPEGMFRCYLVHDQVAGFGHQAINALYPPPPSGSSTEAPQPGPRLYYPPTMPEAQPLKRKMEQEWLPAMQQRLKIDPEQLPVLWDADFLLGPKAASGEDTYILCEINVSSVAPFPDSAIPLIAEAALRRAQAARQNRWDVQGGTVPATILFLCPHNAAKSVIAAAYFNRLAEQHGLPFTADSAGTDPSATVSPAVAELLQREGIDVSSHQPRRVIADELEQAHHIISLGCTPEELGLSPELVEQWLDVPMVSQDLAGARDAIRTHVEAYVADLQRS